MSRVTKDNEEHIRKLLEIIGEDPDRPGPIETPKRVLKAYDEWFADTAKIHLVY